MTSQLYCTLCETLISRKDTDYFGVPIFYNDTAN
jgi:hypothetical protein